MCIAGYCLNASFKGDNDVKLQQHRMPLTSSRGAEHTSVKNAHGAIGAADCKLVGRAWVDRQRGDGAATVDQYILRARHK